MESPLPATGRRFSIYVLKDPRFSTITDSVKYVGWAFDAKLRLRSHLFEARSGKASRKCKWIQDLGSANLAPAMEVIETGYGNPGAAEILWVGFYKSIGCRLTNGTPGGGHIRGHSPEARAEIAASRRGIKRSAETIAKMSAAAKGRKLSPEHRAKLSIAWRSRKPPSTETRAKWSVAARARKGETRSDAARAAMSARRQGTKLSAETRNRMSATALGRKKSPETLAKMCAAQQNRKPISTETRAKLSAAQRERFKRARAIKK